MSDGVCAGGGPGWDSLDALFDLTWLSWQQFYRQPLCSFRFREELELQYRLRKSFKTAAVLSRSRSFKYREKGAASFHRTVTVCTHSSQKGSTCWTASTMQSFAVSFYFGQPRAATELCHGDFGFFGFSFSWFHFGSNFGSNPTDIVNKVTGRNAFATCCVSVCALQTRGWVHCVYPLPGR